MFQHNSVFTLYPCAFHLMHGKILSWRQVHQLVRLPPGSKRQKRLRAWDLPICQYPTFFLRLCILISHSPRLLICLSSTRPSWGHWLFAEHSLSPICLVIHETQHTISEEERARSGMGLNALKKVIMFWDEGDILKIYIT